jgi:hypothetical protein
MTKTINAQTPLARRFFQGGVGLLWLALCLPVAFAHDLATNTTDPVPNATLAKREVEKHEAKAKDYELQASTHRAELDALWAKFARERRKIAVIPKMVGENPYIKKLRVETEREEAKLISLAREAEASAQYHRMRAREWATEQERIAANQ